MVRTKAATETSCRAGVLLPKQCILIGSHFLGELIVRPANASRILGAA